MNPDLWGRPTGYPLISVPTCIYVPNVPVVLVFFYFSPLRISDHGRRGGVIQYTACRTYSQMRFRWVSCSFAPVESLLTLPCGPPVAAGTLIALDHRERILSFTCKELSEIVQSDHPGPRGLALLRLPGRMLLTTSLQVELIWVN